MFSEYEIPIYGSMRTFENNYRLMGMLTLVLTMLLAVSNVTADIAYPGFDYASKYVTLTDGSRIHYVEEGNGAPVLLVHGAPTQAYLWRNVIPHLSSNNRVIAIDLPNFGKSDKVGVLSFPQYTARFGEFVNALGLDDLSLVVHDIGGPIALNWANANRKRVARVSLLETFLGPLPSIAAAPTFFREPLNLFNPDLAALAAVTNNGFVEGLLLNPLGGLINRTLSPEEAAIYRDPFDSVEKRLPLGNIIDEIAVFDGTGHPVLDPDGIGGEVPQTHRNLDYFLEITSFLQAAEVDKHLVITNPGGTFPISQLPVVVEQFPDFLIDVLGDPTATPGLHFLQEDLPDAYGLAINEFINTSAVPLPAAWILMLAGMAVMGQRNARNRNDIRIYK